MGMKKYVNSISFIIFNFLLTVNLQASTLKPNTLERYLHAYYQFNININLMWWDETNKAYQQDTLAAFPAVVDSMEAILQNEKLAKLEEIAVVRDNWHKAHDVLIGQGLINSGEADIALISYYHLYIDNVRKAILALHEKEPSASQKIKTWILLDRLISTYVELNMDIFGAQYRTVDDQDNDIGALVVMVDENINKLSADPQLSSRELNSLKRKWQFIRPVLVSEDQQALPYIVLVHGRRMIELLGGGIN